MPMPPMLAYTVRSALYDNEPPCVVIDVGKNQTKITPAGTSGSYYWFVFLDANNPKVKVKERIVPGYEHSAVPPGLEADMSNPKYIFAVATYGLPVTFVPQGPFYDFFAKYGAGRELQRLEQISATVPCGGLQVTSYVLTSQGGPREPGMPKPAGYDICNPEVPAVLMLSLMPQANGKGPYSIMDSYTWTSPPAE